MGSGEHLGVVGEAEVVVGAEVEDLAGRPPAVTFTVADCGVPITRSGLCSPAARISSRVVRRSSRTESNMGRLLKVLAEGRKDRGGDNELVEEGYAVQSRMIFPLRPLAASSKAVSKSRWEYRPVITGARSRPPSRSTDMAYQVSNIARP
ncbi:hypothetical protein SHIRM173S_06285 [Streptomyces hirsutus]